MKSTFLQKFLTSLLLMMLSFGAFAQLTTSSLVGSVKDTKGEALIGATVVAVHNPTGTNYGNITNENGLFNIQNMKVGGPYTINISYVGYKTYTLENVTLRLGDPMRLHIALLDDASVLSEVEVVYQKNAIIIMDLLVQLQRETNTTIVLITHDAKISTYADNIYHLDS